MGFDWDNQPKALEIALQHVEDSHGISTTSRSVVYEQIRQSIIDNLGVDPKNAPSTSEISNKLSATVKSYKRHRNYTLTTLWAIGIHIIDLSRIPGCTIALNPRRQAIKTSSVGMSKKRTIAEVEDAEEQRSRRSTSSSIETVQSSVDKAATSKEGKQAEDSDRHNLDQQEPQTEIFPSIERLRPPLILKVGKRLAEICPTTHGSQMQQTNRIGGNLDKRPVVTYIPIDAPQRHASHNNVASTMHNLMMGSWRAVRDELGRRAMDPTAPFRLDGDAFSKDALKVLKRIFGNIYDLRLLRARLDQIQVKRRLAFSTFLQAFIGASITMKVFEKPPFANFKEDSSEQKVIQLMLDKIMKIPNILDHFGFYEEGAREALYQYGVWNHVERDIKPTLDLKASTLAHETYCEIMALLPAHPHPIHYAPYMTYGTWPGPPLMDGYEDENYRPDPGSPVPDDQARMDGFDERMSNSDDDNETQTEESNEFLNDLTNLYKRAIHARADWEAAGHAIWSFKFPSLQDTFYYGEAFTQEIDIDLQQLHSVFVTTMPSVWAQTRLNPGDPWGKPRCMSMASVYILDPKWHKKGMKTAPLGCPVSRFG